MEEGLHEMRAVVMLVAGFTVKPVEDGTRRGRAKFSVGAGFRLVQGILCVVKTDGLRAIFAELSRHAVGVDV